MKRKQIFQWFGNNYNGRALIIYTNSNGQALLVHVTPQDQVEALELEVEQNSIDVVRTYRQTDLISIGYEALAKTVVSRRDATR